ncbi:hypothetical protein DRW03_05955 [Corallococcus sp. H22C18031201]|uniref:tetratricopeptide repeat protein n=1 Tax=Citreicoccus inhibens TaxID=2849499 RepID=UPI000E76FC3D|nr:hypothetical protein [Citreicoccus inhibens]MBU8896147.1 hypothetical protein [Citreicoccus inhibens]RJS26007.1 hypothetical protein DRW03_05955 [Corallococcus sp. H22C18031201]
MSLPLALAAAALLAAEPSPLPPGHPVIPPGTQASPTAAMPAGHPAPGTASATPAGALPPGHPTLGASGMAPAAPTGPLPVGHPAVAEPGRAPPSADELLKQLDSTQGLREREKTFEIASSLGRLYYLNGRHTDAITYLQQAEGRAQPVRDVFLAARKKLGKAPVPTAEAANCGFTPGMALEAMATVAQERVTKGDTAGAAACARAALTPVLDVEVMRGNSLYLTGNAAGALAVYTRVLELEPGQEEALFARSSVLFETQGEDLSALKKAAEGFDTLVNTRPNSPRAPMAKQLSQTARDTVKAGGRQKYLETRAADRRIRLSQAVAAMPARGNPAEADGPRALTPEMVEAVQNTEHTPEMDQGLAKLVEEGEEHLAHGRYQEALANYTRVVPFQPQNGRAKAGMAWALVGLGRPMATRIWGVAVQADAAAVEALGDTLKSKGDAKGAKALWEKLAQDAPEYSGKAGLQAKLAQ